MAATPYTAQRYCAQCLATFDTPACLAINLLINFKHFHCAHKRIGIIILLYSFCFASTFSAAPSFYSSPVSISSTIPPPFVANLQSTVTVMSYDRKQLLLSSVFVNFVATSTQRACAYIYCHCNRCI